MPASSPLQVNLTCTSAIYKIEQSTMKTELSEPIPLSPDVLRMIVNLEKELRSQNERIEQIETKIAQVEKNLKILIDELRRGGYINLPERRKVLAK